MRLFSRSRKFSSRNLWEKTSFAKVYALNFAIFSSRETFCPRNFLPLKYDLSRESFLGNPQEAQSRIMGRRSFSTEAISAAAVSKGRPPLAVVSVGDQHAYLVCMLC